MRRMNEGGARGRRERWRRWSATVLVAVTAAAALIGAGVGTVPTAEAATPTAATAGAGGRIAYNEDQFAYEGFDFRNKLGAGYQGAYIRETGKRGDGYSPYANVAVALVDPRGLTDAEFDGLLGAGKPQEAPAFDYQRVPLDAWQRYLRPSDYQELHDQGVEELLMVRAMSFPGQKVGLKKTGFHSEALIEALLKRQRTKKADLRELSWYTDREPCEKCDGEVIENGSPVYFTREYGLTPKEKAERDAALAKFDAQLAQNKTAKEQLTEDAKTAAKLPALQRAAQRKVIGAKMAKLTTSGQATEDARKKIVDEYQEKQNDRAQNAAVALGKDIDTARKTDAAAKSVFVAAPADCPQPQSQSLGRTGAASRVTLASFPVRAAATGCGAPQEQTTGGLAQGLAAPALAPGGIDFSRLELRYLADPGSGGGLRYAFKAPLTASGPGSSSTGLTDAKEASDSFFTWLELAPATFWVNLNPTEPDRIVDSRLGSTDTGRVLLQADLTLKKTTGRLIHPDTKLGASFWRGLSGDCLSFRTWIVPAPATVYAKGDELYILKSPLNVEMETQYLKLHGSAGAVSCPKQSAAVQTHNEALFRRLILPKVVQAVNTAPEYAALRRVYLSRVAAEWYRKLSLHAKTSYGDLIDQDDVSAYTTHQQWTPLDTFHQYVRSYTKGEFKVTHRTRKGDTVYTDTYVYGGVDFTTVPYTSVTAGQLKTTWPTLARDVSRSLAQPVAEQGRAQVWLGGGAPAADAGSAAGAPNGGTSAGRVLAEAARWLLAAALLTGLVASRRAVRRHRARRR